MELQDDTKMNMLEHQDAKAVLIYRANEAAYVFSEEVDTS